MNKKKVFVGLSGGVDSSVSAALLKEQGYDVTGVFIKTWHPEFLPCTWKEDRLDAMRVASHLDIPFETLDLEKEYREEVAEYMIREYERGRTPNPDVMCNKWVKFGGFLSWARARGADHIATGHYARVERVRSSEGEDEEYCLYSGVDKNKDQSYFLWTLTQDQLRHTLFPIGEYTKPDVRALAERFGLPTAAKKDSQGVCFLGALNMREFLKRFIPEKRGDVVNTRGEVIGYHEGAVFYTLGARRGFVITKKGTHDRPYYIVAKDVEKNILTVSHNKHIPEADTGDRPILLEDVNWTGRAPSQDTEYKARYRYRGALHMCHVDMSQNIPSVRSDTVHEPLAAGQSLVLYDSHGELCFGGGVIR